MKKQFLDSGKIVGTHGIKGEVRIDPWCDSPEFLCAFKKLWLDENGTEFIEVKSRPHKNIALAKIKGVDTIEAAEKYRGKIVYINRDDINLAEGVTLFRILSVLRLRMPATTESTAKFPMFCVQAQTMFTKSKTPTARHTLLP